MTPRRLLVTIGVLLVLTTILASMGLPHRLWSLALGGADRWRAGFYALGQTPTGSDNDDAVVSDLLLRLNAENAELRRRIREYDSIQAELGTRIFPEQLLRARVVSRSADHGRHFLEIDRGALSGVAVGDPVVVGWTLVGVVRGERANRSLVQLLSDRESRVAVSIYAATLTAADGETADIPLAQGVIAGVGERHHLQVVHVEARSTVQIREGMHVVTSGLDEHMPFGLAVGEVVEARPRPDSDLWDIVVQPLRPWGSYPTVVVIRRLSALSQVPTGR